MGIFKTPSERRIKKLMPLVKKINSLEPQMQALTDAELRAKTIEFKERLNNGETLDDLLPEAFAAVREAAVRTVGMRPYDVQIIGGIVLHQGRISEMKTGEGKTLVAVLPAYLNALTGKGVYIVTVNEYLAARDASWMGKIHNFMGLTVGCILSNMSQSEKKKAYNCDITYGTNSEFGFDYLRDNMVIQASQLVQRELNYAIIDEVDSILIDEARTPLIISGLGAKSTDMYVKADSFVKSLERGEDLKKATKSDVMMDAVQEESGDYMVNIKERTVILTARGVEKAERYFGIDNLSDNTEINHYIYQALSANALFTIDKDYIVSEDGEVLIVDTFTGRVLSGRRYSDGLHQAIEAKEGVAVKNENMTIATITYQNYFRMFSKLAGMTGTAMTEEEEFRSIYNLDVVEIPTNRPLIRVDMEDAIFSSTEQKNKAIIEEVKRVHATGQPILVGTASVEMSETLSRMLAKTGIKHEVLNAKQHMREAEIVAQAGKLGRVTIATNMAGRGTDILLGGNPDFLARRDLRNDGMEPDMIENATAFFETDNQEILEARRRYKELYQKHKAVTDAEHEQVVATGGLYILGTERHESRRVDNQLRGRAGRQGDPGKTQFLVSLQDELVKRFGGERLEPMRLYLDSAMKKADDEEKSREEKRRQEAEAKGIEYVPTQYALPTFKIVSKFVETAQKRIEAANFDMRKHVLEYDDVMNHMRTVIYEQRRKVLMGADISDDINSMISEVAASKVYSSCNGDISQLDKEVLIGNIKTEFDFTPELKEDKYKSLDKLIDNITEQAFEHYAELTERANRQFAEQNEIELTMSEVERVFLLNTVSDLWIDHIDMMDQLRQGIGLRAYGQADPIIAYRNEGGELFDSMIADIRETTVRKLFHFNGVRVERREAAKETKAGAMRARATAVNQSSERPKPHVSSVKVGRNDPCPCGSGKKYKHCCGKNSNESN